MHHYYYLKILSNYINTNGRLHLATQQNFGLAAWALLDLQALFVAAVLALALLSSITFVLRVVHVGRQLSIIER